MKRRKTRPIISLLVLFAALAMFSACTKSVTAAVPSASPIPSVTDKPDTFVLELEPDATSPAAMLSTVAPLPTATPTPAPAATPVPADPLHPAENVYTIAWLSDSQHYSNQFPETFTAQTRFLSDNAAALRIAYIVHTGDLVHNRDKEEQWQNASSSMKLIEHIPNGVLAGNHDVDVSGSGNDYSMFKKYFGEKRYKSKPWYGGSFDNNRGHYDLIEAGHTRYIFVYLGYNVDSAGMKWVNQTLAANRDRVGVLCVHGYFDSDLSLTAQGEQLYKNVVAKNPNLYMVLCGHRYNCACVPVSFDDDGDGTPERTVLQMIQNYQAAGPVGGDGYLRLLEVDEDAGLIRHYSYSPVWDDFVYFDTEEHRSENHAFSPNGEQGEIAIPWPLG